MLARVALIWMLFAGVAVAEQKVVVLIDDSGSMNDEMRGQRIRKMDAAKRSLTLVLENLPTDSQVGVLTLNNGWLTRLDTVNRAQLRQRIMQIRARGGTPLGTRMKEATNELLKHREKNMYGDYRLLVVTDGEAGDQDILDAALPDIMTRGILVDVIGVDMASQHSLATRVHHYRRADDPRSLEKAISSSLAESAATDSVGGDSDFELLADFPAEIAPVVLSALTSPSNDPIGERDLDFTAGDGGDGDSSFPSSVPGGPDGGGLLFGAFFCLIVVFVIVSTVSFMFRSITRAARRRG